MLRHSGEKEWRSPGHRRPSLCSDVRRKMLIIRVMVTTCELGRGPRPLLHPGRIRSREKLALEISDLRPTEQNTEHASFNK